MIHRAGLNTIHPGSHQKITGDQKQKDMREKTPEKMKFHVSQRALSLRPLCVSVGIIKNEIKRFAMIDCSPSRQHLVSTINFSHCKSTESGIRSVRAFQIAQNLSCFVCAYARFEPFVVVLCQQVQPMAPNRLFELPLFIRSIITHSFVFYTHCM